MWSFIDVVHGSVAFISTAHPFPHLTAGPSKFQDLPMRSSGTRPHYLRSVSGRQIRYIRKSSSTLLPSFPLASCGSMTSFLLEFFWSISGSREGAPCPFF
mmetsp:Transcript_43186/g.111989  ORF Transcript_43186/g.111989 Transcript_43186/m.111989 type:complete len:100 (-) Transcript_43186:1062-1361(-)